MMHTLREAVAERAPASQARINEMANELIL